MCLFASIVANRIRCLRYFKSDFPFLSCFLSCENNIAKKKVFPRFLQNRWLSLRKYRRASEIPRKTSLYTTQMQLKKVLAEIIIRPRPQSRSTVRRALFQDSFFCLAHSQLATVQTIDLSLVQFYGYHRERGPIYV